MTDTTQSTTKFSLAHYGETKPRWLHTSDGHHVFEDPRFGTLEIGAVPGKSWDQWTFHENNGGGSLMIGYAEVGNQLMIMMLLANRFNLKGDQDDWELPGGFTEDGETKLLTAVRETIEETDQLANPTTIPGRGYVGNRAFFVLNNENEGTSVFAFRLSNEQIQAINHSDKLMMMSPKDAINTTRDALSGTAIGRFVLNYEPEVTRTSLSKAGTAVVAFLSGTVFGTMLGRFRRR